jgi:hypothetical protein
MDKDYLKIRLNFRRPIYVSSNVLKDQLQISFNQGYLFASVNEKFVQDESVLTQYLPTLIADPGTQAKVDAGMTAAETVIAVCIFVATFGISSILA